MLIRDIDKQKPQVMAVAAIIQSVRPDILLLNEIDHDVDHIALSKFRELLKSGDQGIDYPYVFAPPPNTGYQSGVDLDGDGTDFGPNDAYGFGHFPGQYGMALLSRYPIDRDAARNFSKLRWVDFPNAQIPRRADGSFIPSPQAADVMRLSSKGHWDVPVAVNNGAVLHLLASHPTPPVFDGPEDRNGRRNADEIWFWVRYIDGDAFTDDEGRNAARPDTPFVVLGDLNSDPLDGDSRKPAIRALLTHKSVYDPKPQSPGGTAAAKAQGGANLSHQGDAAHDTSDWRDKGGPGNLRVDYVLPSRDLTVSASGVYWPAPGEQGHDLVGTGRKNISSDHRLVWVDISLP